MFIGKEMQARNIYMKATPLDVYYAIGEIRGHSQLP